MQRPVDNADLCALLDGECSPSRRARIEAEIFGSPPCAERLAAWRRNDAALRFALCSGGGEDYGRGSGSASRQAPRGDAPLTIASMRAKPRRDGLKAAAFAALAGGSSAAALALAVLLLSAH